VKDKGFTKSDSYSIDNNSSGSDIAIEISNLTKRFENVTALDNLSLAVRYGEIFGLLGPNGSGKTTTINIVSGLSKPTSGQVKVLGYDIRQNTHAVHAAPRAVPQETALYEELSACTNMTIHADLYGVRRSERQQRITDMLNLVQLYERRDNRVGTFSGGMKRRLALARALLHDPKLLYLDEPTLGVDVQSRRALWDCILDLKKKGKTILLTTNYLEEANALCDRLAILDHGRLIALDTPSNLKRRYGDTIVEIETTSPISQHIMTQINALSGIGEAYQNNKVLKIASTGNDTSTIGQIVMLVTKETAIRTISQREPNLDEIFLDLTGSALRD
jgi:daunorubicin resistance ABC transporter ATP-binding subunit